MLTNHGAQLLTAKQLKAASLLMNGALFAFLLTFFVVFSVMGFLSFAQKIAPSQKNMPSPAGVVDLKSIDFNSHKPMTLDGEWYFAWNTFVSPVATKNTEQVANDEIFTTLPSSWNNIVVNGKSLPSFGYASYQLKVELQENSPPLALAIPKIGTAYKLFIDDNLMAQAGNVGNSKANFVGDYQREVIHIKGNKREFFITIHVANYAHNWGGIWDSLVIGSIDDVYQYQLFQNAQSLFLIGIFSIVCLYNLVQYCFKTDDLFPLNFSLLFFCVLIRESIGFGYDFGLSITNEIRLEYMSYSLAVLFYCLSLRSAYPKEFKGLTIRICIVLSAVFSLFVAVSSPTIFAKALSTYNVFTIVVVGFTSLKILKAVRAKRRGARAFLICLIALFAVIVHDILLAQEHIKGVEMYAFGMLFLVLGQVIMTVGRFTDAYQEKNKLSTELATSNKQLKHLAQNLEHRVNARTKELDDANKRLSKLANTDVLTQVMNRRGIIKEIEILEKDARKKFYESSIMIIDVDHFKQVNDTFGHDVGDDVLKWMANKLSQNIRSQDMVARWGGEEFLVLLPHTASEGAMRLAEKVRAAITSEKLDVLNQQPVTVSIGVASSRNSESFRSCLNRADKALYLGKQQGRNRVVLDHSNH